MNEAADWTRRPAERDATKDVASGMCQPRLLHYPAGPEVVPSTDIGRDAAKLFASTLSAPHIVRPLVSFLEDMATTNLVGVGLAICRYSELADLLVYAIAPWSNGAGAAIQGIVERHGSLRAAIQNRSLTTSLWFTDAAAMVDVTLTAQFPNLARDNWYGFHDKGQLESLRLILY